MPHTLAGAKFVQDRELKANPAWLKREGVKVEWRDFCSHLLMPWNRCRRATSFASWKCHTEKHAWEECMEHECVLHALLVLPCVLLSTWLPRASGNRRRNGLLAPFVIVHPMLHNFAPCNAIFGARIFLPCSQICQRGSAEARGPTLKHLCRHALGVCWLCAA
jgi:hypothetical protein